MIRRFLLIMGALAILASACARHTFNLSPECPSLDQATTEQVAGFITLMVQSVPDADLYPCVERLRPGWDITNVDAEKGRTTIALSSDRLGFQFLRVYLSPSCEISGFATGHPTDADESGALLYQDIDETLTGPDEEGEYEGSWWYVFDGGCVEFEFEAEGPGIDRIADDVREAFSFFPRSLADAIVDRDPESRRGL